MVLNPGSSSLGGLARALHVLFVAHWIGGVGFVTLVALPLASAAADALSGWALFEAIESRFAAQVRWSIPLAGATGLWMTFRLDLWPMVLVWTLFMVIVFIIEPLVHRRLAALAAQDPAGLLRRLLALWPAVFTGDVRRVGAV